MEATSLNLHHGSYLLELIEWKFPHGCYITEVSSSNVYHGSYLMEHTPWKLPDGTYTMEVT